MGEGDGRRRDDAGRQEIDPFTWLQTISGNKEKDFDPVDELIEVAEEDAAPARRARRVCRRGMLTDLKTEMREMKKEMGEVPRRTMPGLGGGPAPGRRGGARAHRVCTCLG